MSTEKNKATNLRWIDAMNKKDLNELDKLADEIFTADFIEHDPGTPDMERGQAGIKKWVRQVLKDNPDMHVTLEDQMADGDKVAGRATVKFTDAATGKPVNLLILSIDRFVGDKIAEEWELVVPGQW
jgi:predicted SnoaL-like aldol condensation-catalyzing enzyme